MPYTPPVGRASLNISGTAGNTALNIGGGGDNDRSLTIAARTGGIRAAVRIGIPVRVTVSACTGGIRAVARVAYDPNLLSAVHAVTSERWRDGAPARAGTANRWRAATALPASGRDRWRAADPLRAVAIEYWRASMTLAGNGVDRWRSADVRFNASGDAWRQSDRIVQDAREAWRDGATLNRGETAPWIRTLPSLTPDWRQHWSQGTTLPRSWIDRYGDGARLIGVEIEHWRQAGYPANAANPGPTIPPKPPPTPWGTRLNIICPLPGARLSIGRVPCVLVAEREVVKRRTYMSLNSASLVRWPDLTPLPCTSMTLETDFDSWCWSLTATLAGPAAWPLVQPNPLACEVLATINGFSWKFLLDVPSNARLFGSNRVTLKGRSRSAWLHSPYTPSRNLSESNPREIVQLAEQALENTGWSIDWQAANWLVPGGRWVRTDTPIGALLRLIGATDDGLYTDPAAQIITAQPRWPVASWLLDGEVADLLVPEDAVITLTQNPVYTQPLNGVYVSGTTHGALALVKIAGTDGALQPDAPLTDGLLCDPEGVAARQRGLNALSDSGAGFEMDAELLLTPEVGLVRPGLIVSIAGMKGISRSIRVTAGWSGGALKVRQSVGLERREVES